MKQQPVVAPPELNEAALVDAIENSSDAAPVRTTLRTDERVLARVTDGIYRQPGSAIRELISNSFDADATRVVIKTDRPRFDSISIEDDGLGMSPAAVAHFVYHIGGSAKRTSQGAHLGVAANDDPTLSPGGRRLIGRIGIGLFSVAQLTDRFQIVTKTSGDAFRTVATVVLKQFMDSDEADTNGYEAGKVNIWREPATDVDAHGTSIVLSDIRPQTRDTLRSRDLWLTVDAARPEDDAPKQGVQPPTFHIGRVDPNDPVVLRGGVGHQDALPWGGEDPPDAAFKKLVDAVWAEARRGPVPNPKLETIFDYYLRMVWLQLGLSIPAPYVDGHPFDIPFSDSAYIYELLDGRAAPRQLAMSSDATIRQVLDLHDGPHDSGHFAVIVDDLQLFRPLRFTHLAATSHQVTKPILLVGQAHEGFAEVPRELSGGPLSFVAYLMWAPKIVPTEHQGVLIRVHESSGTLFDPTFMRYQVSEQTRLRQTTCEIFVRTGLESALNIDRESFNYAHPHVVYMTRWLHSALRRLATLQKGIAATLREQARQRGEGAAEERLVNLLEAVWRRESDDDGQRPPTVTFTETDEGAPALTDDVSEASVDAFRLSRTAIFGATRRPDRQTRAVERKITAIVQLLAAYHLVDSVDATTLERLVTSLREILETEEG